MGKLVERATRVVAGTAGGITSQAASGLLALAGLVTGDPGLVAAAVPAGALVGAATTEAVDAVGTLWRNRAGRVLVFGRAAQQHAGMPLEDLIDQATRDEAKLELLARAVEASKLSTTDWKIRVFARAFVAGVTDQAPVDDARVVVEEMSQLQMEHLRLLKVLAGEAPWPVLKAGEKQRHMWARTLILAADPGLTDTFDALVAKLRGSGMVSEETVGLGFGSSSSDMLWMLTRFGRACADWLVEEATGSERPAGEPQSSVTVNSARS